MSSEKQKADKGNKFRFSKILLRNRKRNEDNLANLAIQLAETNRKLEEEIAERKKVEEELVRNEQRWITTLRSIGDAVIATDTAGNVTFMNKVAEDLTGWSITEAQQKPLAKVFNIVNEQSRQQVESPISRVLKEGTIVGLANHTVLIRKDGSEVPIDDSGAPIKDDNGRMVGVILVFRDITERKKTEEHLRRLATVIADSNDAITVQAFSGKILAWNKGAEKMYGWTEAEALSASTLDLVPQEKREEMAVFMDKLKAGENVESFETKRLTKDGRCLDVWLTVTKLVDDSGKPIAIATTERDITERKRTQHELWQAKNDWERTFDSIPDFIAILDAKHQIVRVNRAMAQQLGVTLQEATGLSCYKVVHGTSLPPAFCPHSKVIQDGKEHVAEVHEPRLGGDFIVSATPLFDEKGNYVGSVHVARNITERKKAEEALRKSERVARRHAKALEGMKVKLEEKAAKVEEYANQMEQLAQERLDKLKDAERLATIGQVAGMVGHDIRNPLQAITSSLYLVESDIQQLSASAEKTSALESLKEIQQNVEYINKIVADLQDYAKVIKPIIKETDLQALCNQVLLKNGVPKSIAANCTVESEVKTLLADPDMLKRILGNLVSNAVHAMPNGGKLMIHAFKEKKEVVITVEDTGIGIPDDIKPKLFTPLFTTRSKGQGFGLPVVKRMAEAMGGTVTFESQIGKGTKFIVRFPPPQS